MEIENCLQELLQDDNTEENGVQHYFDLIASKSKDSLLSFHWAKILPPLLSQDEKNEMREYRRKAEELEQKHFEARRQKHSNLMLKVRAVMDRCQRRREESKTKTPILEGKASKSSKVQEKENVLGSKKIIFSKTNQVAGEITHGSIKILQDNGGNYNSLHKERKWKDSSNQNVRDDLSDFPSIFQKPKLHNFSSPPRRNKADASTSSMMESNSQTLQNLYLDRENSTSSSGTIIESNKLHGEHLDSEMEITASDSLASTVLSMAFTDSSVTSQLSTMENMQQTVKPVQRKLNMDNINHNPMHQSYYQSVKPLTSTPNELQRPDTRSSQRAKKKSPLKHVASKNINQPKHASKDYTETFTEQDRALEKLEMMRKKLMKEKEKQLALLRQQELTRLKKNKNNQKEFDLSHELDVQSDVRLASDMYSIPERSFEGSLTLRGDDQNEDESASDKENNHYQYDPQQRIHHDMTSVVHYRQHTVEHGSQAKRNLGEGQFRPSPYVRQEFLKQFEVVMTRGCDGRDRFSVLTAFSRGFLTRRLLKAEKVQAIIKTIKDISEFIADISKEGTSSYQDKTLQQRMQAQLVAAKQKLHDIFFKIPVNDRMAYISHSRNVAKEREERQYNKSKKSARKLSSATLKAMQRRVGEQNEHSDVKRTSTHSPLGKRKNWDMRVLKPVQSTKSPQLQDKGRLVGKRRPGTAPSPRHSIIKKNTYTSRPATAMTRQSNRKSISRRSVESDSASSRKPSRMSLEGKLQTTVKRTKANDEEKAASSKLPVRRSLTGGQTYRVTRGDEEGDKTQQQYGRPSRLSLEGTRQGRQILVKQDPGKSNRPKTASGARRVTRSMAAKFNKS